jgi:hypothetical protein
MFNIVDSTGFAVTEYIFKSQISQALDVDVRSIDKDFSDLAKGVVTIGGRRFLLFSKDAIEQIKTRRASK